MINSIPSPTGNPEDDPLRDGPPKPSLKSIKRMPRASDSNDQKGERAASALGLAGPMVLMRNTMRIQRLIQEMLPHNPDLAAIGQAFLDNMKSSNASALANAAQGGLPVADSGVEAPPPGVFGAPPPPAPTPSPMSGMGQNMQPFAGGGVGGMAPMPPPMPPQGAGQ